MWKKEELYSNNVFCILPWVHMHLLPSSKALPCCVWPYDQPVGDVTNSSLLEVFNSEQYKELRRNMLNGKSSPGCRHCYEVDGANSVSMRVSQTRRFDHLFDKVMSYTHADGSVDKINMAYFDIRFSNICNFKCRGCSPELSSAWFNDHEKLYDYKSDRPKYISISPNPRIWDELMGFIDTVEVAYFAGGEPLITEDHYRVLDEFIKLKKFDVTLSYNSNLSKTQYKDKSICDYWNNFPYVYVGVSIDDFGKRGEYFRNGMDWEKTVENINFVKQNSPHVKFSVNCTVNAMNVLYITELHEKLVQDGIIDPVNFYSNLLIDPVELRMRVLPKELKKLATFKIKLYMKKYAEMGWPENTVAYLNSIFLSILQYMNQADESELLPQFIERTKKLDVIRGESFAATFPEMAQYIKFE